MSAINRTGLNKANLQVIAIAAMIMDHIAFLMPTVFWQYFCKFIGRITIVIMCFFIAEGYYHTRDIRRYILRMAIFAAIAELPFFLYMYNGKRGNAPRMLFYIFYPAHLLVLFFVKVMILLPQLNLAINT